MRRHGASNSGAASEPGCPESGCRLIYLRVASVTFVGVVQWTARAAPHRSNRMLLCS